LTEKFGSVCSVLLCELYGVHCFVALLHNEWHELAKGGQFDHSIVTSL